MWTITGNDWNSRHFEDIRFDEDDDPNEHMDVPVNTIAMNMKDGSMLYMHADKDGNNKEWRTPFEG